MARLPSSKRQYDLIIHEEARRNLPVHHYLFMLDAAARTGVMPILDDKGKPTGEGHPLDAKERMGVAQYLVDKVLPDVPKEIYHIGSAPKGDDTPIDQLPMLSTEELTRIAAGTLTITDAAYDPVPKPE